MTARDEARKTRFREASAELAAVVAFGEAAEAADNRSYFGAFSPETETKGGTGPKPATKNERWLLTALIAAGGSAAPGDLIKAHPDRFPGADDPDGQEIRSYTSGLHRTGASLVRKGWARRGRKQIRRGSRTQGGPRNYRVTEAGRRVVFP